MDDKEMRETLKGFSEDLKQSMKDNREETRQDLGKIEHKVDGLRDDVHQQEVKTGKEIQAAQDRARAAHHRIDSLEKAPASAVRAHEKFFHFKPRDQASEKPVKFWGILMGIAAGVATAVIIIFKVAEGLGFFGKG